MAAGNEKLALQDIGYVKLVTIGSVNPNSPLSEQSKAEQAALLNRCLNGYPAGVIIGKDTAVGRYMIGEHELIMEKITYHVGFPRKPLWEDEEGRK